MPLKISRKEQTREFWQMPPWTEQDWEAMVSSEPYLGTDYSAVHPSTLTTADIFQLGAALGLTREEVRSQMKAGIAAGAIPRLGTSPHLPAARTWLMNRFAPGYEDYTTALKARNAGLPEAQQERPLSPVVWGRQGSMTRAMLTGGVSEEELAANPNLVLSHSPMGLTPEGQILSSTDPTKFLKRAKLMDRHPMVQATGLGEPFTPELRIGPLQGPGPQRQPMRVALTIGEMEGGGQGTYDPSRLGFFEQRNAIDIWPAFGQKEVSGLAIVGETWERGQEINLAAGKTPFKDYWWNTQVLGYEPITKTAYQTGPGGEQVPYTVAGQRAILRQFQVSEQINLQSKYGGGKIELVPGNLANVTNAEGLSLNLDILGPMKDWEGTALQWAERAGMAGIANVMGVPAQSIAGKTYQELQPQFFPAWMEKVGRPGTIDIMRPIQFHESQMDLYRGMLTGEPTPVAGMPGFFSGTARAQAFVGDVAGVLSQSYHSKGRAFFSAEDLANLQATQPAMYKQVMQESYRQRRSYGDVVRSTLANTGIYEQSFGRPVSGFQRVPTTALNEMFLQATSQARGRLGLGPEELLPTGAATPELLNIMAKSPYGRKGMIFGEGAGMTYVPSARSLQYFAARGPDEGIEVSKLLNTFTGMVGIAGGGGDITQEAAAMRGLLQGLGTSSEAVRRWKGAFANVGGAVQHVSPLLAPNETFVPGMEAGQLVMQARQPFFGQATTNPAFAEINIGEQEALRRGFADVSHTYRSPTMVQLGRGDTDGDAIIQMKIAQGQVAQAPGGQLVDKTTGKQYSSVEEMVAEANRAVEMGAAPMSKDVVGYGGETPTLSSTPKAYTPEQYREALTFGVQMGREIGPAYNATFRGKFGVAPGDEAARVAMEQIHAMTYERTQRPAEPTPGMRYLQDLARGWHFGTGGMRLTGAAGGVGRSDQPTAQGLMTEGLRALKLDKMSPEMIAAANAPAGAMRERVQALAQEYYATAGGPLGENEAFNRFATGAAEAVGGGAAWATGTPMGQMLAGPAAKRLAARAAKEGWSEERLQRTLARSGIGGSYSQLLDISKEQELGIAARSRGRERTVEQLGGIVQQLERRQGPGAPRTVSEQFADDFFTDLGKRLAAMPSGVGASATPTATQAAQEVEQARVIAQTGGGGAVPPGGAPVATAAPEPGGEGGGGGGGRRGGRGYLVSDFLGEMGMYDPTKEEQAFYIRRGQESITIKEMSSQKTIDDAMQRMSLVHSAVQGARLGEGSYATVDRPDVLSAWQKAGMGRARDIGGVRALAESGRTGVVTKASLGAITDLANVYEQAYVGAKKAGAPEEILYTQKEEMAGLNRLVTEMSQQFKEGPGGLIQNIEKANKALEKLGASGERYNEVITKATGTLEESQRALAGGDALGLKRAEPYMQLSGREVKQQLTLAKEMQKELEKGGQLQSDAYKQVSERVERLGGLSGDIETQMFKQQRAELEGGVKRGGGGRAAFGRIFGLAMLPWQLQFAQMWGGQQAAEQAQYAGQVSDLAAQATFAMGQPTLGMAEILRQRQALASWNQYYLGQGAAIGGVGAIGAQATGMLGPAGQRGFGALETFGPAIGYGLAGEMVAQQSLGKGLLFANTQTNEASLLFSSRIGRIASAALAPAAGFAVGSGVANAVRGVDYNLGQNAQEVWRDVLAAGMGGIGAILNPPRGATEQGLAAGVGATPFIGDIARGISQIPGAAQWWGGLMAQSQQPGATFYTGQFGFERQAAEARRQQEAQDRLLEAFRAQGFAPEEAATYATAYAKAGMKDVGQIVQQATRAREFERAAGIQAGTLAGLGNLGWSAIGGPGAFAATQAAGQQMNQWLMGLPTDQFARAYAGLGQAAQAWGERPAWAGLAPEQAAGLYQATAMMSPFERQRLIQTQTGTTPLAYSNLMRRAAGTGGATPGSARNVNWGVMDLALTDEMGRPINYPQQRALELAQRSWGVQRQQFQFGQEAEQIAMQGQWQQQSYALQDIITPLQNRYRVENADMSIARLQLQLQQAQGFGGTSPQAIQRQLFELNNRWRIQDINTAGARAQVQYTWQQQDFARERSTFEMQQGWQQEDFDEAIRYSTGRQRIKLIEQQERATQMGNIQRAEMTTAEGRAKTQYGWGVEDREKALARLKQESALRRQLMDQDEEANKRSLDLLKQQLAQEQERRKELVEKIIPAEQAQEKLQREQAAKQLEWRKEALAFEERFYATIQPLQDAYNKTTDKMQEAWYKYQFMMENDLPTAMEQAAKRGDKAWSEALKSIQDGLEKIISKAQEAGKEMANVNKATATSGGYLDEFRRNFDRLLPNSGL